MSITLNSSSNVGTLDAITSSANGSYMYALIDFIGVYKSTDYGVTWNKTYDASTVQLTSITCSSDGSIVYFCWVGGGLFQSTDYGETFNSLVGYVTDLNCIPVNGGPYIRKFVFSGNTVIMGLQGGSTYLYICTNFSSISLNTNIWTSIQIVDASSYISNICMSSNSTILYAIVGPNSAPDGGNSNIYTSTNSGSTWNILPGSFTANWTNIVCDSTGTKVYAMCGGVGLYIFSPSDTNTPLLITSPNTSNFGPLAVYSNASRENLITGTMSYIYNYSLSSSSSRIMCLHENSKILCYLDNKEVYVPIPDIKRGTLVKTHLSGYVAVNMIGTSKIYNEANSLRGKNRLYKCSKDRYPELTEDLIITGCHSILVDYITDEQRELSKKINGDIYITENKYRLIAMLDERLCEWWTFGRNLK